MPGFAARGRRGQSGQQFAVVLLAEQMLVTKVSRQNQLCERSLQVFGLCSPHRTGETAVNETPQGAGFRRLGILRFRPGRQVLREFAFGHGESVDFFLSFLGLVGYGQLRQFLAKEEKEISEEKAKGKGKEKEEKEGLLYEFHVI